MEHGNEDVVRKRVEQNHPSLPLVAMDKRIGSNSLLYSLINVSNTVFCYGFCYGFHEHLSWGIATISVKNTTV